MIDDAFYLALLARSRAAAHAQGTPEERDLPPPYEAPPSYETLFGNANVSRSRAFYGSAPALGDIDRASSKKRRARKILSRLVSGVGECLIAIFE